MKKLILLLTAMIFSMTLFTNPVLAGSKQHYRWEGVAIGLGAAILGSSLINNYSPEHVTVVEHRTYYQPDPPHYKRYCEPQRVWVPPVYDKVWNPGHYDDCRYISGRYIMIERSPGYWAEERSCRKYR
jgi:hypothetical protein